ncbi:MAG TPA: cohesin domain-containing protein [Terracidiphilus sp.]|jgi:general secretion pathway protein D
MIRDRFAAARKPVFWSAFWIALVLVVSTLACVPMQAQSASALYKRGQAAEARNDFDTAFNSYQQAEAKAPKDLRIRTALYRVRVSASGLHVTNGRKLLLTGDMQGALAEFLHAAEIDPGNEAAQQEIARLRTQQGQAAAASPETTPEQASKQEEIDSMGSPVMLRPVSNEPLTLHMAEDAKVVYQAVGRAAGINVLFDPDYISKRIQVDLNNVSLLDALRIVGTMSNTFWRPVTSNSVFVAQNTRAKRTELDEQAVQTFYLTNAWQQNDLNDVQTALRNVLTNIKVYGVASQNALVVRGTPDELLLAQKLINDLDKARPEVVVDIAVMEVSKNWERTLGLQWPTSASVALQTSTTSTSSSTCPTGSTTCTPTTGTSTSPTLYNLAHLNSNNFAVTIGSATANLLLTDSNTKILQNPRLRATDSQKATMKIGERIPIATGSYQTGAATALVSSLVNTQFQYLDVGVNIEITPTVHFDRDVTLKMKIEVTAQNGSSTISGVTEPIIAQKSTEEVVRLREGEANILSGILNQQDQVSWSGIPGLSSIPILKYLFGSKDHTITDDEVVFLMVPHVVRSQDLRPVNLRTIDTGVGQSIELRHLPVEGPGANSSPQVQPVTTNSISPNVGTVPGASASSAAPAAMAQLKAAAEGAGASSPVPQTNLGLPAQNPPPPPPGPAPPGQMKFLMSPPSPVAVGNSFQIPVVVSGATDIASVPLQIQYDPARISLVNVDSGDFLSRDGQAVALVHRDDGPGNITINASRPPGSPGINGAGVVCVLTFQAKASGNSAVVISKPGAISTAQQPVPAQGTQVDVSVK